MTLAGMAAYGLLEYDHLAERWRRTGMEPPADLYEPDPGDRSRCERHALFLHYGIYPPPTPENTDAEPVA